MGRAIHGRLTESGFEVTGWDRDGGYADVTTVRAATTGELAVDVFYVRDDGSLADPARVEALDRALRDALGRD